MGKSKEINNIKADIILLKKAITKIWNQIDEMEMVEPMSETKQALNDALAKSDTPDRLIVESLDKAICPDPCEHEFFGDYCKSSKKVELVNWKCKKCGLVITDNAVTTILNRFADIENWLND